MLAIEVKNLSNCLSILSCLQKQTSGKAKVLGFDIASSSFKIKSQIGIVPQEIALYPTLSAIENLRFFGKIYGLSRKELKDRAEKLLKLVSLWERRQDKVENYSGGMKRRLNLICAFCTSQKFYF
jgi:ABC-2 type transport system ATP-binding protein